MVGDLILDTSAAVAHLRGIAPVTAQMQACLDAGKTLYPADGTADAYARIKQSLAAVGMMIPENDLWIAAFALEHSLPLATRDEHFTRIPGLSMLDWR